MTHHIHNHLCPLLLAATLLTAAACSNDTPADPAPADSPVALELQVAGIGTRAVIDGTTLPDPCTYGVYVMMEDIPVATNVAVNYAGGVSTPETPIYLPYAGVDYQVMAFYPYRESATDPAAIDLGSVEEQIDFLYVNRDPDTDQTLTVTQESPTATLHFHHAMARITLRIRKAEDNTNDYRLTDVVIDGIHDYSSFNLLAGHCIDQRSSLSAFDRDFTESDLSAECEANVLVFPVDLSTRDVRLVLWLNGEQVYAPIPTTVWRGGEQYTYEVVINDAGVVRVGEAVITPWENNTHDGITVDNDDQVE